MSIHILPMINNSRSLHAFISYPLHYCSSLHVRQPYLEATGSRYHCCISHYWS